MPRQGLNFLLVSIIFLAAPGSAARALPLPAATMPSKLAFTLVTAGLSAPVFVTHAGDSSNRLFIVQQTGQIRIFKNGGLLSTPFLNISGLVPDFTGINGEQGLLGLAFDPGYVSNGNFYITYTATSPDPTFIYSVTLARYHVSGDPDLADAASGSVLLSIPKKYPNHNGGMIAFGPDTFLYMSVGDGGSGGDPDNNAQNIHTLLGKIMRLDVESYAARREEIRDSSDESVLRKRRPECEAGDLGLWPSQPVAHLVRPPDRRSIHRRCGPERPGRGGFPSERQCWRTELRMARLGGQSLLQPVGQLRCPLRLCGAGCHVRSRSSTVRMGAPSPVATSIAAAPGPHCTASTSMETIAPARCLA